MCDRKLGFLMLLQQFLRENIKDIYDIYDIDIYLCLTRLLVAFEENTKRDVALSFFVSKTYANEHSMLTNSTTSTLIISCLN